MFLQYPMTNVSSEICPLSLIWWHLWICRNDSHFAIKSEHWQKKRKQRCALPLHIVFFCLLICFSSFFSSLWSTSTESCSVRRRNWHRWSPPCQMAGSLNRWLETQESIRITLLFQLFRKTVEFYFGMHNILVQYRLLADITHFLIKYTID